MKILELNKSGKLNLFAPLNECNNISINRKEIATPSFIEVPKRMLNNKRNYWYMPEELDIVDYVIGHNNEFYVNDRFKFIGYQDGVSSRIKIIDNSIKIIFNPGSNAGYFVRLRITNLNPDTLYSVSYTPSHIGDMGGKHMYRLFGNKYLERDNGVRVYDEFTSDNNGEYQFHIWYDNNDLRYEDIVFSIDNIMLSRGDGKPNWAESPEDFGIALPSNIESLYTGVYGDILLVGEVEEM